MEPLLQERTERTSRSLMKENYTLEDLSQHFHLPINEAARRLSICCTSLKKLCRKHGIKRWPHRKIKSLDKAIAKLEDMKSLADQKQRVKHQLFNIRTALIKNPEILGELKKENSDSEETDAVDNSGEEDPRQLPSVRDLLNTMPGDAASGTPDASGEFSVAPDASFIESFQRLFGSSLVPYGVIATSGHFITANPALQNLLGLRESDLRRGSLVSLVSHEDKEFFAELLSGNVNAFQRAVRLVTSSGQYISCLANLTLVRGVAGNPSYLVASFQDLDALQRSCFGLDVTSMKLMTEQLRCAFDFAAVAVVLLTPEGRVQLANPYACNLFGYESEEFMGRSVDDLTHPDSSGDMTLREALSGSASSNFLFNRKFSSKNGALIRAHVMLYRRVDSYGQVEFYIVQFKAETGPSG